jgi:predicted nucleic acid-binding Zn finger protein
LQDSAQELKRICDRIRREKNITKEVVRELKKLFGDRAFRAIRAVQGRKVKKYIYMPSKRVRWIVVGRSREYMVLHEAEYCSCEDFYFLVVSGFVPYCYHILAQKIAEALGRYDTIREDDSMYEFLSKNW